MLFCTCQHLWVAAVGGSNSAGWLWWHSPLDRWDLCVPDYRWKSQVPAVGISLMSSACVDHAAPAQCAIRLFPLAALVSRCSAQVQL